MRQRPGLLTLITLAIWLTVTVRAQETGSILERIQERGELICGINPNLAGFSQKTPANEWVGFDIDICRAVAAAVLGDANAVQFIEVNADDRPIVLQTGQVDLISRNTTLTLSRDTDWHARFGPITFYDGQGIMVWRESGITSLEILAGGTICVQTGTTTELNIREAMENREMPYKALNPEGQEFFNSVIGDKPETTLRTFSSADDLLATFFEGRCDAITTDRSGLAARRASAPDPDALMILDEILSKEPLAPLSPDSDPAFANVVLWTVYGLIQAEEYGITSENLDDKLAEKNPSILRFLGRGTGSTGDYLNINNDFMYTVIAQVGNYGQIYDRHLGVDTPLGLERGLNQLYTQGGLLYSPPFR